VPRRRSVAEPAPWQPRRLLSPVTGWVPAAVCALVLFVVFPWGEPHLPSNDVSVDG
jgi:hypothetical protein